MEFVEPIRDKNKIEAIRKLLSGNKRDVLLFTLGVNSALRVSDLINLKWVDVVDDNGKPHDYITLRDTKTNKHNRLPLTKKVKKAIQEHYQQNFKGGGLDQYLFQSRKGYNQPLKRQAVWRIIKDAAKDVGVKNIGSHSLRKTWAYHSYKAGTDIVIIQDMLNHSAPSVTLRYIGITQDDKDRAVLSLDL
ncbi:tyrosine-type recombinase/integrase [Virgibacillus halodenitrificans]|uniref:Tyrosine-type recombinase/integrase n=1 Tax=Virgibacillus halodenitrificans TaxID=1482 RepID=A0ABR7VLG5_VIRHA|nr:tyrosine-type recombinase/integrase [Virgibacillus halodenitrificans]MBD1222760.1 tyrosine-type recombinase/integrase [Virgibacillus halodenitrificans]